MLFFFLLGSWFFFLSEVGQFREVQFGVALAIAGHDEEHGDERAQGEGEDAYHRQGVSIGRGDGEEAGHGDSLGDWGSRMSLMGMRLE